MTLPIIGKLGDAYGKKKVWIIGMSIYAISMTLTGFAWSLPAFIIFRAFSGFGLATFALSYGLIRDEFPTHRIAPSLGNLTAAFGVGATVGQLMGGFLAKTLGWRWNFFTLAPISVILAPCAAYKLRESPVRAPRRLDLKGATTLSIAFLTFLVAMTQRGIWGVDLYIHH